MGPTVTRRARLHARIYDVVCGWCESQGLLEWRERLVGDLRGDVVEIGSGTGRNFRYYPPEARVLASDLDPGMLERAVPRAERASAEVHLFLADGQQLPLPTASVDTLVWGLMLCSVPDPGKAIAEARRVLRPEGRVRFIEHIRDRQGSRRAKVQDAISPVWRRVSGGCNCNRRTDERVKDSELQVREIERFELGNLHTAPHVFMEAVAPAVPGRR